MLKLVSSSTSSRGFSLPSTSRGLSLPTSSRGFSLPSTSRGLSAGSSVFTLSGTTLDPADKPRDVEGKEKPRDDVGKGVLIDSHCHLDQLETPIAETIQLAEKEGVKHFLCVSITLEDFPNMMKVIQDYHQVSASVGLHPNEIVSDEPTTNDLIHLAENKKIIAIGETGLDYFRSTGDVEWQRERFRRHIHAAKETGKPLIVHSRNAKEDTLRILREENASSIGGVLHCFTEDMEMAAAAMELNFYISFSGIVTFNNAKEIQHVAKEMPLDRMLIETDSPYLAPVPHRGKPNQPAYVRYVAESIAKLRDEDFDVIASHTTANFSRLFHINTGS